MRRRLPSILLAVGLAALAAVAGRSPIPLFMGFDYQLGSAAALLVAALYGPALGACAGLLAAWPTVAQWGHAWGIAWGVGEAIWVGIWVRRRLDRSVAIADAVYWLLLGGPLVLIAWMRWMLLDGAGAVPFALAQVVTGVANALAAGLVLALLPQLATIARGASERCTVPYRALLFSLTASVVVFPALAVTAMHGRQVERETETAIRSDLRSYARRAALRLDQLVAGNRRLLSGLALAVGGEPVAADATRVLDAVVQSGAGDMTSIELIDQAGQPLARVPQSDSGAIPLASLATPRGTLAQRLESANGPVVEIVTPDDGGLRESCVVLGVRVASGAPDATGALGAIPLERIAAAMQPPLGQPNLAGLLCSAEGRVIWGTADGAEPGRAPPPVRSETLQPDGSGILRRLPVRASLLPPSERWRHTSFVVNQPLPNTPQWALTAEMPVSGHQPDVDQACVASLATTLSCILPALALAFALSRGLSRPLQRLADLTTDLPARTESGAELTWPGSTIAEIDRLSANTRATATVLAALQAAKRETDERIETEVAERTAELLGVLDDLQASEVRYRSLFHGHPAAMLVIAPESGAIVDCNEAAARYYGVARTDLLHARLSALDTSPGPALENLLAQAALGGRHQFPSRHRLANGTVRDVTLYCGPVDLPTARLIYALVLDVTDRTRAEEALRETRDWLESLLAHASAPIVVWDADCRITRFNQACERLTGRAADEVAGADLSVLFPEESRQASMARIMRAAQGDHLAAEVLPIARVGGTPRTVLWTTASIYASDGHRLLHTIAQGHDVTDLRAAEQERERLEARTRAMQRLESLGVLAGTIANDFNAVLASIFGFVEMAMAQLPPRAEARTFLEEVLEAGHRARGLVRQILTFCRRAEADRKPASLEAVVREALELTRTTLPPHIEIRSQADPAVGPVLADATQIQQAITNLCTNALQAMQKSGGLLEVTLDAVTVDEQFADKLGCVTAGRYARLTIRDTGCGMDQETLEHAFEPFFTTRPMGEGTGLGLATTHGIITSHGGAVTAYSELGIGTTFRVYLPVIEQEPGEPPAAPPAREGGGRVLLVDDEETLAQMGSLILSSLGYEAATATSAHDAMAQFLESPDSFAAVITDQTMPRMTGEELARELHRVRPSLPVILVTGLSFRTEPDEHVARIIPKHYNRRELAEALACVLGSP